MTVTKRRSKTDAEAIQNSGLTIEPGIKYTCDYCAVDITATVRIKCAHPECEEVDLCPVCFSEGRQPQSHKAWHDYKVVEKHSKPIFNEDWGADEELLLITGLQTYGLGNWADVAEQVGTRTKEDCERHYIETYLRERPQGRKPFMPRMKATFDISQEVFSARKKRRIEEMRKPQALPAAALQATGSQPSNHEVAGFMPGRLEFDTEVENEAEVAIKDMEFGLVMQYGGADQPEPPDAPPTSAAEIQDKLNGTSAPTSPAGDATGDGTSHDVRVKQEDVESAMDVDAPAQQRSSPPAKQKEPESEDDEAKPAKIILEIEEPDDVELKLTMLGMYYEKLNERTAAKDLIFDRGLMEYKKNSAAEKKRPKEDREILNRYKVFAKLQTAEDFEILVDGLIYENMLRKRILELQEYRRQGITTAADAARYDAVKQNRYQVKEPPIPMSNSDRMLQRGPNGRFTPLPVPDASLKRAPLNGNGRDPAKKLELPPTFKPVPPKTLGSASSLDLLASEEQALCATLHILPKPYLVIKDTLLRENARRGGLLSRKEARKLLLVDSVKVGKVYDFLKAGGLFALRKPVEVDLSSFQNGLQETPSQAAAVNGGPPTPQAHGEQ